ncbi:unnamed protein product [Closterium sp. NIES-53]
MWRKVKNSAAPLVALPCPALPCPAHREPCQSRAALPCPRAALCSPRTALLLPALLHAALLAGAARTEPPCPARAEPPCCPHRPVARRPAAHAALLLPALLRAALLAYALLPAPPCCAPPCCLRCTAAARPVARSPAGRRHAAHTLPCWQPHRCPHRPTHAALLLPALIRAALLADALLPARRPAARSPPCWQPHRSALPMHRPAGRCPALRWSQSVVPRYSSTATAALGHLILLYLFPELSAFVTVEHLVTHLRTCNARYHAALPAEFLDRNPPPRLGSAAAARARVARVVAVAAGVVVVEAVGSFGGGGGSGGGSGIFGGGGGGSGGGGGGGGGGSGSGGHGSGGGWGGEVERGGSGGGQRQHQQRRSETPSPKQLRDHAGHTCGKFHTQHRCFSHLDDAWCAEFGDEAEHPRWLELLRSGVDIFALDCDGILAAMYALSVSAGGDCYLCVPPGPGIEAAALGTSESALPRIAPAEVLHTFTIDSGSSRCFIRNSTTLTPLSTPVPVRLADPSGGPVLASSSTVLPCPAVPSGSLSSLHLPLFSTNLVSTAALQDAMVTTTTPRGQHVSICMCTRTGRHLAMFTLRPGSSLYTLTGETPQVVAIAQVAASGPVAAPCSCRLLSHQTLLWHHRHGHPSLPRLRGMHSRLLVSGLLRSLPSLTPLPVPPCLPCVERWQRAAPHSSSFPPSTDPLQTLHMDVWGPSHVSGQDRERYFLLVFDDYTHYTTVFPLRSKGEVPDVLIPWIRAVRLQLRERFRQDLPVLHLHSDRGGEFSSDLLRDSCRWEGILQSITLPASPQQNEIAERRIGMVMDVALPCASAQPLAPCLLAEDLTYTALDREGWRSVGVLVLGLLCRLAIPCVFLGFPPDVPGWQFYHPTSRHILPSLDVTFDETVPFYRLFPYRTAPLPPPPPWPLFLAPGPPPVDPLPPQGPAPSGVSQVGPLPGTVPVEVAVDSGAARGAVSGNASSGGAEPGGAQPGGAELGGAKPGGAEPGDTEPEGAEPGGAESEGAESRGAVPRGAGGSAPGGTGAKGTVATSLGGAGVTAGVGGTGGTRASGLGGARTRGTGAAGAGGVGGAGAGDPGAGDPGAGGTSTGGAGAGDPGARGAGAGGTGAGGAGAGGTSAGGTGARGVGAGEPGARGAGARGTGAGDPGAGGASAGFAGASGPGAGGTVQRRPFFVLPLPLSLPPPDSVLRQLQPNSPLPAPSPYAEPTDSLTVLREPESRPSLPVRAVRTSRRVPRPRPPPIPGTHVMALRPSSIPLRVPLLSPPMSSLPDDSDPDSDLARDASPTIPRLLATVFTDPLFESNAASALVAELVDFAAACRLDYAASLVAESESYCPPSVGGECALGTDVLEDRQEDLVFGFCCTSLLNVTTSCTLLTSAQLSYRAACTRRSGCAAHLASLGRFLQVLQSFGFRYSSPQSTPRPTGHSLSDPPSDESVELSGPYPKLVGCLMYLMTCTRPDLAYPLSILARYVAPGRHRPEHREAAKRMLRYLCSTLGMGLVLGGRGPVVLTGHADASWVDDLAMQRSSSCEAEIYAGAMAAEELRWLTYLQTDLGERPPSSPVLYVDNKAMIALCQEHRMNHIALRYFLARELQQRGQLRLAYVATRANSADIFTKALQSGDHQRFCTILGLV